MTPPENQLMLFVSLLSFHFPIPTSCLAKRLCWPLNRCQRDRSPSCFRCAISAGVRSSEAKPGLLAVGHRLQAAAVFASNATACPVSLAPLFLLTI